MILQQTDWIWIRNWTVILLRCIWIYKQYMRLTQVKAKFRYWQVRFSNDNVHEPDDNFNSTRRFFNEFPQLVYVVSFTSAHAYSSRTPPILAVDFFFQRCKMCTCLLINLKFILSRSSSISKPLMQLWGVGVYRILMTRRRFGPVRYRGHLML